jgi:hypothetical protein
MMASTEIQNTAPGPYSDRSKNNPAYSEEIGENLGPLARDLLVNYSKIPPEDLEDHVKKIVTSPSSAETNNIEQNHMTDAVLMTAR